MMPIVFASLKTSVVQVFVAVVTFVATLRILDRLLVTEFNRFLFFFWHCVVLCCFGFLFVLVGPA